MGSFPAPFPLLLASGDPHLGPDAAALHLLAIETGYDSLPWPLTPSLPRRPASLLSFLPAHPARGPALARRPEARGCRRNARLGGGALCLCVRVAGLHPHSPDSTSQGLSPAFASRIRRTPNHRATECKKPHPQCLHIREPWSPPVRPTWGVVHTSALSTDCSWPVHDKGPEGQTGDFHSRATHLVQELDDLQAPQLPWANKGGCRKAPECGCCGQCGILESRLLRAKEGRHLAKPALELSAPQPASPPARPLAGTLVAAPALYRHQVQTPECRACAHAPRSARSPFVAPTRISSGISGARGRSVGEGGGRTRSLPRSRARLHAGGRGSRGPAAPARWPSKDPPGPMAGGATRPDWCRRSADRCGNPGGGERGRMRNPRRGEPEGRAEVVSRP
ncbi:acyl-CoA 6-desaturase isoform X3 [Chlorocebus sabaeus]|uniref:acyl-CoA 6-desaturase isoform X3 n=1 Tax=Chlorocebus sabaeus TaxID=60711 RepID=UPI003BFA024E